MHVEELTRDDQAERTYAVVMEHGDDFVSTAERVAYDLDLRGANFTAIGGFERVTLGYFAWEARDYQPIPLEEQVEILSLVGNIARNEDGSVKVHAHVVVGTSTGHARGGHLLAGTVRPTLELMVHEEPAHLVRRYDPESGVALIDLTGPAAGGRP